MVIYLDFNLLKMACPADLFYAKDRDTPNKLATERYSAVGAMN